MAYNATLDKSLATFKEAIETELAEVLGAKKSELRFVHRPLTDVDAAEGQPSALARESALADSLMLDSPWLQVSASSEGDRALLITVLWDERQLLIDQASLASDEPLPPSPRTPLSPLALDVMTDSYVRSVLRVGSPEERQAGLEAVSRQIPPDLLWLFRKSWQSTRGPFSDAVDSALRTALKRAAPGFGALVKAVLGEHMRNPGRRLHFKSILEVKELFDVGQYRLDNIT